MGGRGPRAGPRGARGCRAAGGAGCVGREWRRGGTASRQPGACGAPGAAFCRAGAGPLGFARGPSPLGDGPLLLFAGSRAPLGLLGVASGDRCAVPAGFQLQAGLCRPVYRCAQVRAGAASAGSGCASRSRVARGRGPRWLGFEEQPAGSLGEEERKVVLKLPAAVARPDSRVV